MVHTSRVYRAKTSGKPGKIETGLRKFVWIVGLTAIASSYTWAATSAKSTNENLKYMEIAQQEPAPGKDYSPLEHLQMTMTLYGEASNQCKGGRTKMSKQVCMLAVAWVIKNRKDLRYRGAETYTDVIMEDKMFSVWNKPDKNCKKRYRAEVCSEENKKRMAIDIAESKNPTAVMAWNIALEVMEGNTTDPTNGATHYHTTSVKPYWAKGHTPILILDDHVFYKGIK